MRAGPPSPAAAGDEVPLRVGGDFREIGRKDGRFKIP